LTGVSFAVGTEVLNTRSIHSLIPYSVWRHVHDLFQSQFSTGHDL